MVTPDQLRAAMTWLPTGVTIVSATGAAGPAGATANAVTSLSLEPPLMLACLDRGSRTLTVIRETGRFAVNVLGAGDEALARRFATKAGQPEKWDAVEFEQRHEVPILTGSTAWVICRVRDLYDGGDHEIAVGEVLELGGNGGEPLIYAAGEYRPLRD